MSKSNIEQSKHLAELSSDCSMLLTHLIRQDNTTNGNSKSDNEARKVLEQILDRINSYQKPLLKASCTSWYSTCSAKIFNSEDNTFDFIKEPKSVCFTESTLAGLAAHSQIYNAKYGVAFARDFLFKKGACPCINLPNKYLKQTLQTVNNGPRYIYNYIPTELTPFVNVINDKFDSTHEREWRIPKDFYFSKDDILFVFCPTEDFKLFSSIQKDGLPYMFDLGLLGRI